MKALNHAVPTVPKTPNSLQFVQRIIEKVNKKFEFIPSIAENFNWYVEPSIELTALKELFKSYNDETRVNEILIKHYKENTTRILDDLKEKFPHRSNILEEIFFAHNNGFYYLSCIAFMTQVDGVVYDFSDGKNYFHGTRESNFFEETRARLNSLDIESAGLYFLKQLFNNELPIRIGPKKRTLEFEHMNRHQMLHGETTNFNTEINSLKALSLLATLAFNLKYLDDILSNDEIKNNKYGDLI
ncbi:hypothetical protein [Sulfurimonas sp. HSL3-2]|uniref:hypothetical protein n=1 Tax=Hydrocurvibacter mobilis TaxID=3131936 RepID=UPI0031F7FEBA